MENHGCLKGVVDDAGDYDYDYDYYHLRYHHHHHHQIVCSHCMLS